MKSIPTQIWRQLQSAAAQLGEDSSQRDVLDLILLWIRSNARLVESEPFSVYGFKNFVEIDEKLMPVDFSSVTHGDVTHFRKAVLSYESNEAESIARFLRDMLEALVTIEVNKNCPRCETEWMRVFIGRSNGMLAYQCGVCGYSHYSDGARVEAGGLAFVSEAQLQEFGLI
jgi:hypothetical protein